MMKKFKKIIFVWVLFTGAFSHASVVTRLLSHLETDFVNVSVKTPEHDELETSVQLGGLELTPPRTACDRSVRQRWVSREPVTVALVQEVLGLDAMVAVGAEGVSSGAAVKFKSAGEKNSVEEILYALNIQAKADHVNYVFKLAEYDDYQTAIANHDALVFSIRTEWTGTQAPKPYVSRLAVGFNSWFVPGMDRVILNEATASDLNELYLHPQFFSDRSPVGMRLVIEEKSKAARVLFPCEDRVLHDAEDFDSADSSCSQ
jgi:hypothetical protein